ncbi:MAG: hypothetical protein AMXMBFR83_16120 [Phycisphaerae bacterium]
MSGNNSHDPVLERAASYDELYRRCSHPVPYGPEGLRERLSYALDSRRPGRCLEGNELEQAFRCVGPPEMSGRTILDLCCGTGLTAMHFAYRGARVVACDISLAAVEIARQRARLSGIGSRIRFLRADARRLPFADGTFDAVFCRSSLHILVDYPETPFEVCRVLKSGCPAVFCDDPLGHNPVTELVRWFRRRKYRSCGGRTLKYRDLEAFGRPFAAMRVHHFDFLVQIKTLFAAQLQRRWLRRALVRLDQADEKLLKAAPRLRRLATKIVVEYRKGPLDPCPAVLAEPIRPEIAACAGAATSE